MNLKGSVTIEVFDDKGVELEVLEINASEFGLEETGTRNYDGVRAYRGLFVYFNNEYEFDVLVEAEEMNHSITAFEHSLNKHNSEFGVRLGMDNLEVYPTSAEVEYDEDDWH
ncbi:hypothetical protein ABWC92_004603 [Escherichia coli]